ncbi:hypothetical protein DL96DRAFT_636863 [Flagelloscypha sp. PMI_526]|nr:hypothetical protein DL96DRAFT_636863 [Flagelloscypha sp. PMI_526]
MAEVLAITAVALATPPCIHAVTKIWVKVAGMLHLSSPAQYAYLLSRIRHLINKSRAELEKGSGSMSLDMVKEYGDKLNKNIKLYNQLVILHSTANPKTRLDSLKTARKASARLLKDIRNCSRKCADEKLVQAIKACLNYDQDVRSPDGTIAAYHSDSVHSQVLQLPTDATVAQLARIEPGAAQTPPILPLVSTSDSISAPMGSPSRFYLPVEIYFVPQILSSSSGTSLIPQNPQLSCARPEVLGTTTTGDDVPPIDLDSTRISEVASHLEGGSS